MDRRGVGQRQLVELRYVVLHAAAVEIHRQRPVFRIHALDISQVTVENLLIVVVAHLHDAVALAEDDLAEAAFLLPVGRWIECRLQAHVQRRHAGVVLARRREHLNI